MEFRYKMKYKRLFTLCLLLILFVAVVNAEETTTPTADTTAPTTQPSVNILQQNMNSVVDEKSGVTTYTFGEDSAIQIGKTNFMSVQPSSENTKAVLKVDKEGTILEADLTAKSQTTWKFNDQSVNVPEGARVTFRDGKIEVFGKDNDVIKVETPQGKQDITFAKDYSIGSLSSSFDRKINPLQIQDNHITGKNFEVGGLSIKDGGATLTENGVLLDANSISSYNQVGITNKEVLLFSNSENFGSSKNALFMGKDNLKAKGSDFNLEFNEGNPYAKMDAEDYFKVTMGYHSKFTLKNRDDAAKIPLATTSGGVSIRQDEKFMHISGYDDKITIFGESKEQGDNKRWTSPIEIQPLDSEGNLKDKKVLISNFKGFAIVSSDAQQGVTDIKYGDLYPQLAKTDLKYNYPTKEDFERLLSSSGGKFQLIGRTEEATALLDNPRNMRNLIDFYETLPPKTKNNLGTLKIYSIDEYAKVASPTAFAFYDPKDNSVNMKTFAIPGQDLYPSVSVYDFETFRHELSHRTYDIYLEKSPSGFVEFTFSSSEYKTMVDEWESAAGLKKLGGLYTSKSTSLLDQSALKQNLPDFKWIGVSKSEAYAPKYGYVRPYGAYNKNEDMATFTEKITSDPGFFKREGLLDGGKNYDPRYKQKVDLLFKYGFISQAEYNAVFK